MGIHMVLWDFDGTLADSSSDVWRSLVYAASLEGGEFPAAFMQDNSNLSAPMRTIFNHVNPRPSPNRLEAFEKNVNTHYRTINDFPSTRLYPGIAIILEELRCKGIGNVIVTMKPKPALERLLTTKGWEDKFQGWITPEVASGREMTKEAMVSYVLDRWHLSAQDCLLIGDSQADIRAAATHAVRSVGVTYGDGDTEHLLEANPTYVAHEVVDLASILKKEV